MSIERYIVVKARGGWAVNVGADTLSVHASFDDARDEAARLAAAAAKAGRASMYMAVVDGADMVETKGKA